MSLQLSDPTNGNPLGDGFGWRVTNGVRNFHHGQDRGFWSNKPDFRIYAAAPGTVLVSRVSPLLGNYVVTSIDGNAGYTILYAHFASRPSVNVGDHLARRQQFATMGHTGSQAVGTHLHLALQKDGVAIDPAPYFVIAGTAGSTGTEIIPEERRNIVRIIQDETTQEYWRVGEVSALKLSSLVAGQEAQLWGAGIVVSHAVAVQTVRDAQAAGAPAASAVDLAPVEAAVKTVGGQVAAIDSKLTGFVAPPTVEQIAKAVNDNAAARLAQ